MDNKKKELLRLHQQAIVDDLDVEYIVDTLISKHAITGEDLEEISNRTKRSDRARFLIDTLVRKGNNASYEAFVDSLAKDYKWLWKKLAVDTNEPLLNESFEDSLSRGSVPRLTRHYVKRDDVETDVAHHLNILTRHNMLVLHGMSGSGKTSLAISVLRNNSDLITDKFNGSVFWLNLKNCKTEDDIIAQQNALYRKALSIYTRNSHMNSTMTMSSSSSTFDTQSFSSCEWTWQELNERLKSQFSEPVLKDALLVLDEVNEKLCVDAFDIGCKLLITTQDSDVVANFQPQIIEIKNSLKEEQTLKLLASYLEINVSELPKQARKFHEACKGSPFNVTLIGAQLAEDKEGLWHDNKRWNYYLKKLEKREFLIFLKPDDNPMKTIEVCINSLDPDLLQLFKKLAILPHNVSVSPKVLSKLWNMESLEVVKIMNKFHRKSLITKSYVNEQKSYVYELHDLIMNYLRTCFNEEETKKIHSELLESYQYGNINEPPIEIDDDGYIAYYMGYHILNTKNFNNKWKLFSLYLNLKFLGNKIRLTGQADVILDLEKYETYIVENLEPNRLFVNSIKAFLKTYGTDLYRYPHTDILQSILQHESEGLLYGRALDIARKNVSNNEVYFEFVHERGVEEIKYSTIDVKETITSVSFFGDYVLVGTMTGQVKFFHLLTNKLKKELSGASTSIKWVGAYPGEISQVAALTNDGFIKIWHVDDIEQDDTEDIIEEESDEVDNNNYPSNCTINPKMGPFLNCRWLNHQKKLITHTSNMIVMYNCDGTVDKVFDHFEKNEDVLCCVPCNNDIYIKVAVANNGLNRLDVIKQSNKEKVMTFTESDKVLDILPVPGSNKILTLKSTEITVHEYKMNFPTGNIYHTCRCNVVISAKEVKDNLKFLALAVNKTGSLMFVSTDDSRVVCVDLKTNSRLFDLENRRGNVISMAASEVVWNDFEPGSDVLLTGTGPGENSAKVWNLEASYVLHNSQRNSKVRLTKRFDVSYVNAVSPYTTTSRNSSQNMINSPKRYQSFSNHTEAPKKQITTSLSLERHNLKPLNLKGISNNNENIFQPLLAVVDDKNNIQVMRGKKVLTEVLTRPEDKITTIKISPCNHYVIYGLESGCIKKFALRSKDIVQDIMDMNSPVHYLKFVTPLLLIAGSKDYCLMAYRFTSDGTWKTDMLQRGKTFLASQELLNDIQGVKKKTSHMDTLSSSGSEGSIDSKRVFNNANSMDRLRRNSGLVDCYWVKDVGMITIENNAAVKLWNQDMKLVSVLNAKQRDISETVTCAAFQKNILCICDGKTPGFQTFELKHEDQIELSLIQDYTLNNRITSCDLTSDGYILAMGLESGEVVIWNVPGKRQLKLLKHHKNAVQCCMFSPMPDRLFRTMTQTSPSPFSQPPSIDVGDDDNTPLVLITMASEIVWWNVTYILNLRSNKSLLRTGRNALTPLPIPNDNKIEPTEALNDQSNQNTCNNFFFGNNLITSHCGFKSIWKGKKYKEGSKKKEILACIKLSGMNAKKLCRDDKFASFVTIDNSGHIHIMNIMKANKS